MKARIWKNGYRWWSVEMPSPAGMARIAWACETVEEAVRLFDWEIRRRRRLQLGVVRSFA